eukprot:CAMPEP_0196724844 /NCGR_PEP_ID=MMETSP1091-20130531/6574_1 /TAXON_ID=302021 /ORGANISM="Rhodomonas sp., Strain CCMP768" /LENGTH=294 /DNA_ID=CAMNT_0042067035 /DNA_START=8 /DNA_END=892 /DNA_ORIENTATION=-
MGANFSKEAAMDDVPSQTKRIALVLGYAGLMSVNILAGMGKLPLISGNPGPNNAELSGRWPTRLTPAGYAFAIWGPIFLVQGVAVAWSAFPAKRASPKARAINAIAPAWLAMWTFENLWQFTFVNAPMASSATMGEQLRCFVPCSALLCAAYGSSLAACKRLKAARAPGTAAGVVGPLIELSSGVNAGWLSAASCIGAALVLESLMGGSAQASSAPAIALACAAGAGGMLSLRAWGAGWLGLGYTGAVMWALQAVRYGPATPADVQALAYGGVCALGAAAAATLVVDNTKAKLQ